MVVVEEVVVMTAFTDRHVDEVTEVEVFSRLRGEQRVKGDGYECLAFLKF